MRYHLSELTPAYIPVEFFVPHKYAGINILILNHGVPTL